MANNTCTEVQETHAPVWRGFGHWNFYFMAKLGLYWAGSINFDIFYNAVFAAFLLLPLRPNTLSVLRHWLAVPIAIAVLYYDSWLPPIQRLIEQPEVLNFSSDYLLELLLRFINWQLLGTGFIFLVVYLFLASWLRMTAWSLLALLLVALPRMPGLPHFSFNDATDVVTQGLNIAPNNTAAAPRAADMNTVLNEELERFYQAEQSRRTEFSAPTADAAPFDVLLLNVCSLAWSDLEISQLSAHPLFEKMDIMFDQFNSATSYSGPAVIRLMRASCGQTGHKALYQSADSQCHIFENLRALGFTDSAALNHTGEFENFIDELKVAGLSAPPLVPRRLRPHLKGFDGTPIWSDYDALNMWWQERLASDAPATALFYNSITLHDGNREATLDGGSRVSPYPKRAKQLLDDFDSFMQEIEASGRQAMVVFVPEHGAALAGDRMQMSGMREIPAPAITHVPVGVRFIGTQAEPPKKTIHIDTASSYLALSELVSRAVSRAVFDAPQVDWLARGLRAEAAQLYRRESPSFTLHNDSWWRRDGTPGISELNANTTMAHLEFPLTQGRAFLRADHVRMDAGTFKKDATGAYSERFASCNFAGLDSQGDTQSLVGCGRGFTQKADGTSFAAGWTDEQWSFDLGSTPYGFTVQNWVGGISYADKIGVTGFTLTASRRPLSSSLLSFSGTKDPRTGIEWGGVIANGAALGLSWDQGGTHGVWADISHHQLRGKNVADNTTSRLMGGYYRRLINTPNELLTVGVGSMLWHYKKDLSEYTLGHGGYYSPQKYVSLSLPVNYAKRTVDWSYLLEGSVSLSASKTRDMAYYPEQNLIAGPWLELAGQGVNHADFMTNNSFKGGSSRSVGYSVRGLVERRLDNHWVLGAGLDWRYSEDYSPSRAMLYVRYSFKSWQGDLKLSPEPLTPYADFK